MLLISCWRTAPTAELEASVRMQVGAFGWGWTKRVALARASLIDWKAAVAASVQVSGVVPLGAVFRRSCKGCRVWAQLGTKRW